MRRDKVYLTVLRSFNQPDFGCVRRGPAEGSINRTAPYLFVEGLGVVESIEYNDAFGERVYENSAHEMRRYGS